MVQLLQDLADEFADFAQGMVRGYPLLRMNVRKHSALILRPSAHLQSSRRIRGELNHHSFALARFFSKLLGVTLRLGAAGMLAGPRPVCRCERSLSLSPTPTKRPHPLAQAMGPNCAGPTLLATIATKKSAPTRRILRRKSLSLPQPPRGPNYQSNTNVQSFSAASGATVQP